MKEDTVPTNDMLQATKDLIALAVEKQYLSDNYTLFGHKQVRATNCPGETLYAEIEKWPHFAKQDSDKTEELKDNITDIVCDIISQTSDPKTIDDYTIIEDKPQDNTDQNWRWWHFWKWYRYYWG